MRAASRMQHARVRDLRARLDGTISLASAVRHGSEQQIGDAVERAQARLEVAMQAERDEPEFIRARRRDLRRKDRRDFFAASKRRRGRKAKLG